MSDEQPGRLPDQDVQRVQVIWRERWDGVFQAQTQILNWVFAAQGAGLAGTLTYASTGKLTCGIKVALAGFVCGLVLIVVYGAVFYYLELFNFRRCRSDALDYFARKITMTEFLNRESARPTYYFVCEVLAWTSAIAGIIGIVFLTCSIVAGSQK